MKKIISTFILSAILFANNTNAQTAVDFTANDCSGTSHTLFTELDAGKVVVIAWVMPCSACAGPALSAYSTCQTLATTFPNRINYYLADDNANTACSALSTWANTNGITAPTATFSNAALNMNDYGTAGMPKIVVLGGSNHHVYYNINNSFNQTSFNNAMGDALAPAGTNNLNKLQNQVSIAPNPATNNFTKLSYQLISNSNVTIDITNTLGQKVKSISYTNQNSGNQEVNIDLSNFTNGLYFATMRTQNSVNTIQFSVSK
jgi:hypothetical protein